MENSITKDDLERIRASIRDKYIKVADSPEGLFKYPTGRSGIEAQGYDPRFEFL